MNAPEPSTSLRPRQAETNHFSLASMCALAAVVGVVTGIGALLFRLMISLVHNFLFLHTISLQYDSSQFTPPHPWGAWVILVPVTGAAVVTFIVTTFAPEAKGGIQHVVVMRDGRIFGVLRINTRIRRPLANEKAGVTLAEVAQKNYTIVRESDVMFDVITRMTRRDAAMALVVSPEAGRRPPRPAHIRGVITKEHVADSVAKTVEIYPN